MLLNQVSRFGGTVATLSDPVLIFVLVYYKVRLCLYTIPTYVQYLLEAKENDLMFTCVNG